MFYIEIDSRQLSLETLTTLNWTNHPIQMKINAAKSIIKIIQPAGREICRRVPSYVWFLDYDQLFIVHSDNKSSISSETTRIPSYMMTVSGGVNPCIVAVYHRIPPILPSCTMKARSIFRNHIKDRTWSIWKVEDNTNRSKRFFMSRISKILRVLSLRLKFFFL